MSPVPSWPPHPSRVAYFRDPFGTYYAAEVWHAVEWHEGLREPPPVEVADIRLLMEATTVPGLPPWFAVTAGPPGTPEAASAVAKAWPHSPHFRPPGDAPEVYVAAGFQALCPPHPPCDPGPHARASVVAFLRDRPGPLGRIAEEGRDGFDRRLRIHWGSARAFARAIVRERLRDAGVVAALAASDMLEQGEIAPEASEFVRFAQQRDELRRRLDPVQYFVHPVDFDAAVLQAETWLVRFRQECRVFAGRVEQEAVETLEELTPALAAMERLERFNRDGRPIGVDAARRLARAVAELHAVAAGEMPSRPVLGRLPACFSEARLAAAAVIAAVDVQRRRAVRRARATDHSA